MARRSVCYVRVSEEDHRVIKRLATAAELSVSEFLRRAGLGARITWPVPPLNQQAWTELARTASNINQLAHHLNEGRIKGRQTGINLEDMQVMLRRLYGHIVVLRRELIGAPSKTEGKP